MRDALKIVCLDFDEEKSTVILSRILASHIPRSSDIDRRLELW